MVSAGSSAKQLKRGDASHDLKRVQQPPAVFDNIKHVIDNDDSHDKSIVTALKTFVDADTLSAQMVAVQRLPAVVLAAARTAADELQANQRWVAQLLLQTIDADQRAPRSLIVAVTKAIDALVNQEILTEILSNQFDQAFSCEPTIKQLSLIDTATAWPSASAALGIHCRHFLQWTATILTQRRSRDHLKPSSSSVPIDSDSLSIVDNELIGTLRAFVSYASRQKAALKETFVASDDPLLIALLTALSNILSDSSSHRDTITQSAFLVVALATNLSTSDEEAVQAIFKLARYDVAIKNNIAIDCLMNIANSPLSECDNAVAEMAIIRAILSQASLSVMMTCAPSVQSINPSNSQSTEFFCVALLPRIFAGASSLVPDIRYCGLQTTEVWLNKAQTIVKQTTDLSVRSQLAEQINKQLPRVVEILSLNWDHPYRPIQSIARPLFDSQVQLASALSNGQIDWTSTIDPLILKATRALDRGSYQMLTALLGHCDALLIVTRHPQFVGRSFAATSSLSVWGLVSSFLEKLLSATKSKMPIDEWRALFLQPLISCLLNSVEQVRNAASSSFMHSLFSDIDPQSFEHVVKAIRNDQSIESGDDWQLTLDLPHLRALMSVFAVARRAGLISSAKFDSLLHGSDQSIHLNESLLMNCLLHSDSSIRMEALEFLCSNRFLSEVPSILEFKLFVASYPFLLRVADPSTRTRVLKSALHRFLVRIRDSSAKTIREEANSQIAKTGSYSVNSLINSDSLKRSLHHSFKFVAWFASFTVSAGYPAAPFDRKIAGCEVFRAILQIFSCKPDLAATGFDQQLKADNRAETLLWSHIIVSPLLTPQVSCALWDALGCSWQAVRALTFECMVQYFPCPLPGFEEDSALIGMLDWAWTLTQSPRARDSESGALGVKLIFKKYVTEQNYLIDVSKIDDKSITEFARASDSVEAQLAFVESLSKLLLSHVNLMHSTPLSERYHLTQSRLHGALIVARLTLEEVRFQTAKFTSAQETAWQTIMRRFVGLITDIASLSMRMHVPSHQFAQIVERLNPIQKQYGGILLEVPVSQQVDGASGPEAAEADFEEGDNDDDVEVDCRGHAFVSHGGESSTQQQRLMVVSSWLALKEISLLAGSVVRSAPLSNQTIMSVNDADSLGRVLLCVLLNSKHNGVLENTYTGLLTICARLIDSGLVWSALVDTWLNELIVSMQKPNSDSWLRRSRGNAFALMAICEAEPAGRPTVLLERSMKCLLELASGDPEDWRSLVHALNLIRSVFRHGSLHIRCLPHLSAAFECAIRAFSHKEWAVRNAAMISFVPIMAKACRSQQTGGVLAKDFFAQHPNILPIIESIVTKAAPDNGEVDPALYPICLLLENMTAGQESDAIVQRLTSLIQPLLNHHHAAIRQVVASAYNRLTPAQNAQETILTLTKQLPTAETQIQHNLVHSLLTVIRTLLQSVTATVVRDDNSALEFASSFSSAVLACSWLGSAAAQVSMIREVYLELSFEALSLHASLADNVHPQNWSMLLSLIADACDNQSFIGAVSLQQTAAALMVKTLVSKPSTTLMNPAQRTQLIVSLWNDADPRVSRTALVTTCVLLTDNATASREMLDLDAMTTAAQQLMMNTKEFLQRAASFEVMLALTDLSPTSALSVSSSVWLAIQEGCTSTQTELQVPAIEAAGAAINSFMQLSTADELAFFSSALTAWMGWLSSFTSDTMSPSLRLACCESLRRSGLLQHQDKRVDQARLSAWCAAITLMQDESEIVRVRASAIAHRSLTPAFRLITNLGASTGSKSESNATIVSHTVEAAIAQLAYTFQPVDVALASAGLLNTTSQYVVPFQANWSSFMWSERKYGVAVDSSSAVFVSENPLSLREFCFLGESVSALIERISGGLDAQQLAGWKSAQFQATAHCMNALVAASSSTTKPVTFEFAGDMLPVGGWTFDSAVFMECYLSLHMSLALARTGSNDNLQQLSASLEAMLQLSRAHDQLLATANALLNVLNGKNASMPAFLTGLQMLPFEA